MYICRVAETNTPLPDGPSHQPFTCFGRVRFIAWHLKTFILGNADRVKEFLDRPCKLSSGSFSVNHIKMALCHILTCCLLE